MSVLEIVLLVLGIAAFVASYFIPDRVSESEGEALSREEIRNIVYDEYESTKTKLEDLTDETVTYSVEKAERALERITNEKMTALGEYSDAILNQISANHKETVFLHDMLNSNKNDLTTLLGQAVADSKSATEAAKEATANSKKALDESREALDNARNASEKAVVAEDKLIEARMAITGEEKKTPKKSTTKSTSTKSTSAKSTTKAKSGTRSTRKKKTDSVDNAVAFIDENENMMIENDGQISLKFDVDEEPSSANNNDRVLKLHKQGKSNIAIAKELGLGVGEVKLVIDLFDKK